MNIQKEIRSDFERTPGFRDSPMVNRPNLNKLNLLKKMRRFSHQKHILRCDKKLKGERKYKIKSPIVDREEQEIAISIHCDEGGGILTKTGSLAQIGTRGIPWMEITDGTKNVENQQCIAVSWAGNKIPRVSTSSCAGGYRRYFMGAEWLGC